MEMNNTRRTFLAQLGMASAAVGAGTLSLNAQSANAAPTGTAHGAGAALGTTTDASPVATARKQTYPTFDGGHSVLDSLTREKFEAHLGSAFRVGVKDASGVNSTIDLQLTLAEDGHGNDPVHGIEAFSIIFNGPKSKPLGQGTYPFAHPQLGRFDLFIVPIGETKEGRSYQAVFSRLRRA